MHLAVPRFLHELSLFFVSQTVDDAPAVALVALDPEDRLWNLLRFGGSSGALGVLLRREQDESKRLGGCAKHGGTFDALEDD